MTDTSFSSSKSGVRVSADFRDNLIIDRYDPIFSGMRAAKLTHLRSENSEDAITWNVFRSLRQVEPEVWLPSLARIGLSGISLSMLGSVVVKLWESVAPPPGLLALGDEGYSEIDVVIESPSWVWFIEAKYKSDISTGTTTRPARDQVLRNIDVGSYYAGVRAFYLTLLIRDEKRSPLGAEAVQRYKDLQVPRSLLADHRPDGLLNLKAVTLLTWSELGEVLKVAAASSRRSDERGFAGRAFEWMRIKGLTEASLQND